MEKILIVDDSMVQGAILRDILDQTYQVELCHSGEDAIRRAIAAPPNLILLDVIMPGLDGFETLARLKEQPATQNIPVILITSLSTAGDEEKGLDLGAVDYIVKPFNPGIVRARVRTHTQLYAYRRAFETLAMMDELTGIPNRRFYNEQSRAEWFRSMRDRTPLSIGLLDVDYFKQFNDRYGHPSGDTVLAQVAKALTGRLHRSSDFAARYGGEEFVFLLPGTPGPEASRIAEEIRQAVAALQIPHAESQLGFVTVSIGGVTVTPAQELDYNAYFEMVDEMLYRAKNSGRNRVTWSEQDPRA